MSASQPLGIYFARGTDCLHLPGPARAVAGWI